MSSKLMFSTYFSNKLGLGPARLGPGWAARRGCGGLPSLPPRRPGTGTASACPEPAENRDT